MALKRAIEVAGNGGALAVVYRSAVIGLLALLTTMYWRGQDDITQRINHNASISAATRVAISGVEERVEGIKALAEERIRQQADVDAWQNNILDDHSQRIRTLEGRR